MRGRTWARTCGAPWGALASWTWSFSVSLSSSAKATKTKAKRVSSSRALPMHWWLIPSSFGFRFYPNIIWYEIHSLLSILGFYPRPLYCSWAQAHSSGFPLVRSVMSFSYFGFIPFELISLNPLLKSFHF